VIFVNVLEVYTNFLSKKGGVQRHIYDLCITLTEEGHKPLVLTWEPQKPSFEIINGVRVCHIHIPYIFRITRYLMILYLSFNIARLVQKCNIDLIHAHDYLPGVASALASMLSHKPVVVTFHLPIQNTTYSVPAYLSPLFLFEKALKNVFISHMDAVICVSNFTYMETKKLDFPDSKLKVIYNWVTLPGYEVDNQSETLRKFGLNEGRFILSVGRLLDKQKGFSMLIHALKLLMDKGYKLDLVIVGDGSDKEAYIKYSVNLRIKKHVHLVGKVSDTDLAHLYSACDIFVLPSRLEGLPLVLLEAMSFGRPIVATKVGGIPEVIEDGYNGILVDPDPNVISLGIETLLLSPYLKSILAKRSQEIASKKFSKRNCHITIDFLKRFLKDNDKNNNVYF